MYELPCTGGGALEVGNHENMQVDILRMWAERMLSVVDA